jgi:CheY-like chemotaxis protein
MDGYEFTTSIREWEAENKMEHMTIFAITASTLSEDVKRAKKQDVILIYQNQSKCLFLLRRF